jgi:hypothetical protein
LDIYFGIKAVTQATKEQLKFVGIRRLLTLKTKKLIGDEQLNQYYELIKQDSYPAIKKIFNIPKLKGGINVNLH